MCLCLSFENKNWYVSFYIIYAHLVLHGLINPVDQPGKSLSIDGFGQSVSDIDGVVYCEWTEDLKNIK